MYPSDISGRVAQQRYDETVQQARLLRLIRKINAQPQPAPERSLLGRVWSALFARKPARSGTIAGNQVRLATEGQSIARPGSPKT